MISSLKAILCLPDDINAQGQMMPIWVSGDGSIIFDTSGWMWWLIVDRATHHLQLHQEVAQFTLPSEWDVIVAMAEPSILSWRWWSSPDRKIPGWAGLSTVNLRDDDLAGLSTSSNAQYCTWCAPEGDMRTWVIQPFVGLCAIPTQTSCSLSYVGGLNKSL